jgi:hypothetical protein
MSSLQKKHEQKQDLMVNVLDSKNLPDNLEEAHEWIKNLILKISKCMNNISRLEQSIDRLEKSTLQNQVEDLESCD